LSQALDIQQFLNQSFGKNNIIDVRSPAEFIQGHIPGATNIAIFNNEERAEIGTLYKKKGRQIAVIRGLEIVAPKLKPIVEQAVSLAENDTLYVHCWRGGMRSGFVATLLDMYGLKVFTIKGGYKKFRNFVLQSFNDTGSLVLLGGKTGSGKTRILHKLKSEGEQVIDLEGIAHHKGSAFGALGEKPQPSQELFENILAMQLYACDKNKPIWLEDESRLIGKNIIPNALWEKMRSSNVYFIDLPFEQRLKYILQEYGKFAAEQLETSITKISKRLGPEQTKNAIIALHAGDMQTALSYCLMYYDKTYTYGVSQREKEKV